MGICAILWYNATYEFGLQINLSLYISIPNHNCPAVGYNQFVIKTITIPHAGPHATLNDRITYSMAIRRVMDYLTLETVCVYF